MECRCQCGAVRFTTPLAEPLALYICHCFECRLQTSSAFGTSAIFPKFALPRDEVLSCYSRPTPMGLLMSCYFCRTCGTRLLHTMPEKNVVSIKGGCIVGLDWQKAIHIWTKSAMVPIPEGCETHEGEPTDSASSGSQELLDRLLDSPGPLTGSGGNPNSHLLLH